MTSIFSLTHLPPMFAHPYLEIIWKFLEIPKAFITKKLSSFFIPWGLIEWTETN